MPKVINLYIEYRKSYKVRMDLQHEKQVVETIYQIIDLIRYNTLTQ